MVSRTSREERDKLRILPIRVGEGEIEGILFNTIVPDVRARSPTETAKLIVSRLGLIRPVTDPGRCYREPTVHILNAKVKNPPAF